MMKSQSKIEKLINRMERNLKDDDYKYILIQKKLEVSNLKLEKQNTSNLCI